MKTRLLVLLIFLLACLTLSLSGCGGDEVDPPTEEPEVVEPTNGGVETNDDIDDIDRPLVAENVKHLRTIKHTEKTHSIAFSPDGNIIASGSPDDDIIILWDAKTGAQMRTLIGHTDDVSSVAFSPDGETLASGSYDKTIRLWGE